MTKIQFWIFENKWYKYFFLGNLYFQMISKFSKFDGKFIGDVKDT